MWLFWCNLHIWGAKSILHLVWIVKSCPYYWLMISLGEMNVLDMSYFPTAIWPHGTSPYQSDFRLQTLQCQRVMAISTVPLLKFLYIKYSVSSSGWETFLCSETKFTQWVNNLLQIAQVDQQWQAGWSVAVLCTHKKTFVRVHPADQQKHKQNIKDFLYGKTERDAFVSCFQ